MSAPSASRLIARSARVASLPLRSRQANSFFRPSSYRFVNINNTTLTPAPRCLSISAPRPTGIMPDTDNPSTPPREPDTQPAPMDMTDDEYHERADEFMDKLHDKAEEIQEGREDVEVEHAAGVLTINFPPNGTYVLNKQPPNKQIWLSSPITGPKRFDWTLSGESMNQKEGGGVGEWVYLRDGTTLSSLLRKEVGITVDMDGHEKSMEAKVANTAE